MPNRIIKESTFTSDKIASLSDFEFRLWVGLITYVDDAGRGDARPAIIRGRLFALRERVTLKDIDDALHGLAAKGCVSLYTVGGKPYFWFPTWSEHQRIRDVKPKYPSPEESDGQIISAADCGELPQIAADCRRLRPESESNPNTNPNPNPNVCAEPEPVSAPPVIALPLVTGEEYEITQEQILEWGQLYPAVNVLQQLRNMKGWLLSNPERRKTQRGINRFINGWLAKEQNRGGQSKGRSGGNIFRDMLEEEYGQG